MDVATAVDMIPEVTVDQQPPEQQQPQQPPAPAPAPAPAPVPQAATPTQTQAEIPPILHAPVSSAKLEWYENGEMSEEGFRWVKAETVPNQRRIHGGMSDANKLTIAYQNMKIREGAVMALANRDIRIRLIGKNTPMGITNNGGYDPDSPEEKLAIIKVGTTRKTQMQMQLEEEIRRRDQPVEEPVSTLPTISTLIINDTTAGEAKIVMYKDTAELRKHNIQESRIQKTYRVKNLPKAITITYTVNNENELWSTLNTLAPEVDQEDIENMYMMIRQIIENKRRDRTFIMPIGQ